MPKVDHLGYAVSNLDEKKNVMEDLLGFQFLERRVYERPGNTARLDFYEAEGAVMELVEMSDPEAPLKPVHRLTRRGTAPYLFRRR